MKFTQLSILYMLLGIIFTESSIQGTRINTTIINKNHEQWKKVDNDSILLNNKLTDEESAVTHSMNIQHGIVMKDNSFGKAVYEALSPTVHTVGNNPMEKIVDQAVDNIGSMNHDNSDTSYWKNVSYKSSTFELEARIQVALLLQLKIFYIIRFINISWSDVHIVEGQSNKINVSIYLQASLYSGMLTQYNIYMTVTQNAGVYMWSYIRLYDGLRNYVDEKKRFRTKIGHSYRCDAPDTIVLENSAAIFIRNFYYRGFIDGSALKQVEGCQGSYTYTLYGSVGAFCAILICVTIVTVIIKYRRWYKERAAYENMDRRFQP